MSLPLNPTVGQIAIVNGTRFQCTQVNPNQWKIIGGNSHELRIQALEDREVTPEFFGVVEGYHPDNADKIEAMIASGKSIDWGDKEYGVDRCIGGGTTLLVPLDWKSDGARIYLESGTPQQQAVLWYEILPVKHTSQGTLIFDANQLANVGILLENKATPNYPVGYGEIVFDEMQGINARRTLDYIKGSGITIEGAFTSVILNSPKALDCTMATGAGVAGSQGIAGIEVVRDSASGGYSLYTEINNPEVVNITSEDNTYYRDQDGIKVFGEAIGSSITLQSTAVLNGGIYRNCWGRSIKGQVTNLTVNQPTFQRDTGWSGQKAQAEIDSQFCKPTVTSVKCIYDTFTPSTVLECSAHPNGAATSGYCNGISVTGSPNIEVLDSIVSTFSYTGFGIYEVTNVEVEGAAVVNPVLFRVVDDSSEIVCKNWRLFGGASGAFVRVLKQGRDTSTATVGKVTLGNIVNDGSPVDLVESRVTGFVLTADLTVRGRIIGFNAADTKLSSSSTNPPAVNKTSGVSGYYNNGSFLKPFAASIDSLETHEFPTHGYSADSRIAIINAGFSRESNCMITCNASGIVLLSPESTNIDVGQTSEPSGSSSVKIWMNSTTGGLNVKNNTGSAKVITVYYM